MSKPNFLNIPRFFDDVLDGNQTLTRSNKDAFLNAICTQVDQAACLHRLVSRKNGLSSLRSALRQDLSPQFLNGTATQFLSYLQSPVFKKPCTGQILRHILLQIVQPPAFWNQFVRALRSHVLSPAAQACFAWLLLELLSLPEALASQYRPLAGDLSITDVLVGTDSPEVRALGHRIRDTTQNASFLGALHDNDFTTYQDIAIYPTIDEIQSKRSAILRAYTGFGASEESRGERVHLHEQFWRLRDEMVHKLRDEWRLLSDGQGASHPGLAIEGLELAGLYHGTEDDRRPWGLKLRCKQDLADLKHVKQTQRKSHVLNNPQIVPHQSFACLFVDGTPVAFASVCRDADLLSQKPPVLVLQLDGIASTKKALRALQAASRIKMVLMNTSAAVYEPVLRALQNAKGIPLASELLHWNETSSLANPPFFPDSVVQSLLEDPTQDLKGLLHLPSSVVLDASQVSAFISGLTQTVSLIHGAPGTGKSLVGSLLVKALHALTEETILVCCNTERAVDQFVAGLRKVGVPEDATTILGKSASHVKPFMHSLETESSEGRTCQLASDQARETLEQAFTEYTSPLQNGALVAYLKSEGPEYLKACQVPHFVHNSRMKVVDEGGVTVTAHYLLDRWIGGKDAGMFKDERNVRAASKIWRMPPSARDSATAQWKDAILEKRVATLVSAGWIYNSRQAELEASGGAALQGKRVIACTVDQAAEHWERIRAASPSVVVVNDATEVPESHLLAALGCDTEQLILIGDTSHSRPQIDSSDLDNSLFERLVLRGYPQESLVEQHRMRSEIAALIRELAYPKLVNNEESRARANLRGLRDNIVLIDREVPEDEAPTAGDAAEARTSAQNAVEVKMVLKIVKYLAQHGYGTNQLIVLTPCAAQLRKLQEAVHAGNDPTLKDLDSYDLVRAGQRTSGIAKAMRKPLRISTIDDYRGEESNVVIASLALNGAERDKHSAWPIHLLSRARLGLIMVGDLTTLSDTPTSEDGDIWTRFFRLLARDGHVYRGLPVRCVRHPQREGILSKPEDFDDNCPEGGCMEICESPLPCGLHTCRLRCHQITDHSKVACDYIMTDQCAQDHTQSWQCYQEKPVSCKRCDYDGQKEETKKRNDYVLQQTRDAEYEHKRRMAEIEAQIAAERQIRQDASSAEERRRAFQEKELELEAEKSKNQEATSESADGENEEADGQLETEDASEPGEPEKSEPEDDAPAPTSDAVPPAPEPPSPEDGRHFPSDPPLVLSASPSQVEWQRQKDKEEADNSHIDAIMEMIGLEQVKLQVLRIKAKIDITKEQGVSIRSERFNIVLLGNPGTGKSTIARHYARFLTSMKVVPGSKFVETSGADLTNRGLAGLKADIERIDDYGGGVLFVDEAYQLTSNSTLNYLLTALENKVGRIVFIFAGYNRQMERFFEHNPGLMSRVPYKLQFHDYTDNELLLILRQWFEKKYEDRMKVEDGYTGLYSRIVVRRVGRNRGFPGFGNARALQNTLDKVTERQADRIVRQRKLGLKPNCFTILKEDLIGPDPSLAAADSVAWKRLRSLTGLGAVKEAVQNLIDLIDVNYRRELQEQEPIAVSLNRVFLGSPGTGKTTVAQFYGQILVDLGLLSNGEVVIRNPADFIGRYLGESETNTKRILQTTVGKVLVIDEAYMLWRSSESGGSNDSFRTAVIDTIVAEVQNVPGEDRCVLLLGYEPQMRAMFQNVNPGLSRRFALEDAFKFEDFTESELEHILDIKLKQQQLRATDSAKTVAMEVLKRARNKQNFGNGGAVENLLSQAKARFQSRQAVLRVKDRAFDVLFEPWDFDPDFDRVMQGADNLKKLFEDVVGCEDIVRKLDEYQHIARVAKAQGKDPLVLIPTSFVFKGPPGTGKTTTARKMGQVYYNMGFLSSPTVQEVSASDLIGKYIGHTGPKTKQVFERALGQVLFIDEAYRLGEGHYAKEAIDEIVTIMTLDAYRGKIVVILAGYDQEMNRLMQVNTGLSSRFPEEIVFENMKPERCLELLSKELRRNGITLSELNDASSCGQLSTLINMLSALPSWGNARDVQALSKQMLRKAFQKINADEPGTEMRLSLEDAIACTRDMLQDRVERCSNLSREVKSTPTKPLEESTLDSASTQTSASSSSSSTSDTEVEESEDIHNEGGEHGQKLSETEGSDRAEESSEGIEDQV